MSEKCPECKIEMYDIGEDERDFPAESHLTGMVDGVQCLHNQLENEEAENEKLRKFVGKVAKFKFSFDSRDTANAAYRNEVRALQKEAAETAKKEDRNSLTPEDIK